MHSGQDDAGNSQPQPRKDLRELEALLAPAIAAFKANPAILKALEAKAARNDAEEAEETAAAVTGKDSDLEEDSNRNAKVTVRLTEEEKEQLQDWSGGARLSTYIRDYLFNYPSYKERPIVPEVNRLMYLELGRIGNNLNQIARAANLALLMGNEAPFVHAAGAQQLGEQIQSLNALIQEVRTSLVGVGSEDDEAEPLKP